MHSAVLLAITALPFLGADALKSNLNVRCGIQSKRSLSCENSVFGSCCSKNGYCGSSPTHCGTGCQAGFGDCKPTISTPVKSSSGPAKPSSTSTGSSGSSTTVVVVSRTLTSKSSTPFTMSTSTLSTMTSPPVHATSASSSTTSSSAPASSSSSVTDVTVSTDGSCGGAQGFTCSGSTFGDCCSEFGWCGSTSIYCDAGCNAAFGGCNSGSASPNPTSTSSSSGPSSFITSTRTTDPVLSPTEVISINGQCGASSSGMTCSGSQYGDCCSQYGYCGGSSAFCGTGCQSGFGKCDTAPLPGKTCGVEGFANKTEYYASSFNLIDAPDVSTCVDLCLLEPTCMSYLFNPELGNCAYLEYSLLQGEFIATPGTDQLFWDRACAETTTA